MLQPDLDPAWDCAVENAFERCGLEHGWAVDPSSFGGGHSQNLEAPEFLHALVLDLLALLH